MKATGIVRKVDDLGRVVIPIEIRRTIGIDEKDALEVFVEKDHVILKKYTPTNTCVITGEVSEDNLTLADGKMVLSKNGAKQLLSELETAFQENN